MNTKMTTTTVVPVVCFRVGQTTFFNSTLTSRKNSVVRTKILSAFGFSGLPSDNGRTGFFSVISTYSTDKLPSDRHQISTEGYKKVAGQEGVEPPTAGFGVRSSTNWSY